MSINEMNENRIGTTFSKHVRKLYYFSIPFHIPCHTILAKNGAEHTNYWNVFVCELNYKLH